MKDYVVNIISELSKHANPENASYMKAYMKYKFEYLGIKSPQRRDLTKPFLAKTALPSSSKLWGIMQELWEQPEREYQYVAMELAARYSRVVEKAWIDQYEFLIVTKSWWDTVDFIAATLVGNYFNIFPEMIDEVTDRWMISGNIWLQRTCLLFQLKYKDEVNTELLASFIKELCYSREFFIAKAIGWALREYSKRNPSWVLEMVDSTDLQPLSKREALRLILKKDSN